MEFKEAIKKMLKDNNLTQQQFAIKCGYVNQGGVSGKITRNTLKLETLIKWANAVDYDVVLRPRSGKDKAERTIIITLSEEQEK